MNKINLLNIASFTPRSIQSPNAWVGHLPFAAWVIQEVRPKIFVELGTHSGNSYFSFCQSIAENCISTKCYAVDTWQGDEHAGIYADDIYSKVSLHNKKQYSDFSQLLRMTFDEASSLFLDGSIELFHIDGLHTYEAVCHDFESWLPKLAPGAVVMFHDTSVHEMNFGVWKLWKELQARYPNNLEFIHSHGLGVLQLNDASDTKRLDWLQPNSGEKQLIIDYFSSLGSWQLERYNFENRISDLNQSAIERDMQISLAQTEIIRIKNTASWIATKPMRLLASIFRSFSKKLKHKRLVDKSDNLSLTNQIIQRNNSTNINDVDAYALLLKRFAPNYKDRVTNYIEGLLKVDHYHGRFDYLRRIIGSEHFHSGAKTLVSGYGAGSEMLVARQLGLGEIHGVEVDKIWMDVTQKRFLSVPGIYPECYDGLLLPYQDSLFNIVISGHVIEHTSNPEIYIHECMRVLIDGGYLSLEFPHRYHHTELHTQLPSLEWLPRKIRDAAVMALVSRLSPLTADVKARYASIITTNLQQISMGKIRQWLESYQHPCSILDVTKAAPGILRCVVRKNSVLSKD